MADQLNPLGYERHANDDRLRLSVRPLVVGATSGPAAILVAFAIGTFTLARKFLAGSALIYLVIASFFVTLCASLIYCSFCLSSASKTDRPSRAKAYAIGGIALTIAWGVGIVLSVLYLLSNMHIS